MGAVINRSLGALVGGLFLIGHYFWTLEDQRGSRMELNTGIFILSVGLAGLLYWNWRRKKAG
jgi:hypothetical protein